MRDYQEKILNYLLFFLLSLIGLSSLFLVKNNYLYLFILIFLLLYWQKVRVREILANYFSPPSSFPLFLALGMVGVLLFQVFSGSPRFYQRPILTLLVSLVFYLPYFFLWYKIFQRGKISLLGAFFLAGLGGVIIFGLIFGRLTTTVSTAPTLVGGLFYALLKASGILTVVGVLTSFPFLFFSDGEIAPLAGKVEKKDNTGFGLIEVLIVGGIFLFSLSIVGIARHRQKVAQQRLEQIKQNRVEKLSNLQKKITDQVNQTQAYTPTPTSAPKVEEGQVKKSEGTEQPRPQAHSEKKESRLPKTEQHQVEDKSAPRPQAGRDTQKQKELTDEDYYLFYDQAAGPDTCQTNPSIPGCEVYNYDPYSDPNSPEYQQQLMEEWYYSQPSPEELFFNDPMQLLNQDPNMYEMFENIYDFEPIPGFP